MLLREAFRAFGNEVNVRTFAEYLARSSNRIGDVIHTTDAARAKRGAVHDEGIELDLAFAIEEAATASVKGLVIFHNDDSFLGSFERGATFLKDAPSGSDRIAHAVEVCFDEIVRDRPRPPWMRRTGLLKGWSQMKSFGDRRPAFRFGAPFEDSQS